MLKLVGVNAVGTTSAVEPIMLTATDTVAITAADYSDPLTGATFPATTSADGKSVPALPHEDSGLTANLRPSRTIRRDYAEYRDLL